MRLDVDTKECVHASPDYLWNECAIYVDTVLVPHVQALDTIEGWVKAYDPLSGYSVVLHGAVEYCAYQTEC